MSFCVLLLFAAFRACCAAGIKERLIDLEIQMNSEALRTKSDIMELRYMIHSLNTSDRSVGNNYDDEEEVRAKEMCDVNSQSALDDGKISVLVSAFRAEKVAIRKEIEQIRSTCIENFMDLNSQKIVLWSEMEKINEMVKLNKESIARIDHKLNEIDETIIKTLKNNKRSTKKIKVKLADIERRNNDFINEWNNFRSNFKQEIINIIDSQRQLQVDVCPDKWMKFEDLCYFYDKERKLNWTSALQACLDLGGKLVEPDTEEKVKYILNVTNGKAVWLGASDSSEEGVYVLESSKKRLGKVPWAFGQPNNYGGDQDCIECESSGLNDENCYIKNSLFCEM